MPSSDLNNPDHDLDALMREAMGESLTMALGEPTRVSLCFALPGRSAEEDGRVTSLTQRMSDAALQGYSRKRH